MMEIKSTNEHDSSIATPVTISENEIDMPQISSVRNDEERSSAPPLRLNTLDETFPPSILPQQASAPSTQPLPPPPPPQPTASSTNPAQPETRRYVSYGLRNLGNTCYANSCLQALFATNKIRRYFRRNGHQGRFHQLLRELFGAMKAPKSANTSTPAAAITDVDAAQLDREFRRVRPEFVRNEQQDAQEFLTILLELLHQEANQADRRRARNNEPQSAAEAWRDHIATVDDSYLSQLLMGQLESSLTCLECGNVGRTWSCFWQMQLHLSCAENNNNSSNSSNSNNTNNGNNTNDPPSTAEPRELTLIDCMEEYTAPEILRDDCAPYCGRCKRRAAASKQQSICRAPHYLIVHLKRFDPSGCKITRAVTIDEEIRLCGKIYFLQSCVLHRGTETIGHYTTLTRDSPREWIWFDDDIITRPVAPDYARRLLRRYAYICVYKSIQSSTVSAMNHESTEEKILAEVRDIELR